MINKNEESAAPEKINKMHFHFVLSILGTYKLHALHDINILDLMICVKPFLLCCSIMCATLR